MVPPHSRISYTLAAVLLTASRKSKITTYVSAAPVKTSITTRGLIKHIGFIKEERHHGFRINRHA